MADRLGAELKPSVDIRGIQPEIVLAISIITPIFLEFGYDPVITSIVDGLHSAGSLHYVGFAVDYRAKHIDKDDLQPILKEIRRRLPKGFDVILHGDRHLIHYHVEFQPKKALNK